MVEARNTRETPYVNRVVPTHLLPFVHAILLDDTQTTTNQCNLLAWVQLCALYLETNSNFWSFGKCQVGNELGDGPTESLKVFKRSKRRLQRQDCSEKKTEMS